MEQTINIEQIFGILRKYRRLILSSTVVCTLLAVIVTFFLITPQYSASTELLVNRKQSGDANVQWNQVQTDVQMINTYKDLITKPVIMDSVAKKINKGSNQKLDDTTIASMIGVSNNQNSQVFSITAKADNAYTAADIANTTAQTFQKKAPKIMSGTDNVSIISEAKPDLKPVSPKKKLNVLIGLALGILLGVGIAFLRELTDKTVKDESFLTDDLGLTSLGVVNNIAEKDLIKKAIMSVSTSRLSRRG
ncbi:Wzz/FepE/Etk N-terminal domain-containing protein [Latilactobacillus curvatus]|uniref:YveK family protein n=1 Tax=Latilactobacillus curvatus TaxID=28038 RepID=UPI0020C79AA9|nr:Wzz/FepE/Etk N-terminal domain-containing protein [Latilactobacillus curvatus]MCP8860477.1 chain-length determining protein [Latilactobacillus curvatus]MCP8869079.1 Wzz/FepE/Etk N-terminal domain-containing protein [Latilactobacillus curvatus]MCP8872594.1 Wzz/FepE/Etk N-terminal domain-containing protein [Latilactobacillus curvatus]MCP8881647.1 Wzz/FepE/Etk N-terminal domain-containing protein [Latilactobacillus curvatus]